MPAPVRRLTAALAVLIALTAVVGCGGSANDDKPNPALGPPNTEGPPKRSMPGATDPVKKKV